MRNGSSFSALKLRTECEIERNRRSLSMAITTSLPIATPVAIPVREILPWAIFGGLLLVLGIYFVGVEEGAAAVFNGMYVHEFVHDGRHLLGFPCH
jgi:hypothetical protein